MKINTNQLVTTSPYRGFAIMAIPGEPCFKKPLDATIDRILYMTQAHPAVMQMTIGLDFPETMQGTNNTPMVLTVKNLMRDLKAMGLSCHHVWIPMHCSDANKNISFSLFILVAADDPKIYRTVINKLKLYWAKAIGVSDAKAKELVTTGLPGNGSILHRDTPEFIPALWELINEMSCEFLTKDVHATSMEFGASVLSADDNAMVLSCCHNNDGSVKVGPNGHPIGYTRNGDKVEWLPDQERPGKRFPLILRRNDKAIQKAYEELRKKAWWHSHQWLMEQIRSGEIKPSEDQMKHIRKGVQAAKRIEKKYGRENLLNDPDLELLHGRVSALAWVLGTDWEDSGDL